MKLPGWRPLAALMAGAGITHLVRPTFYEPLVPPALGPPRPWVTWSGLAELACAAGLAYPRTRRPAALATAVLLVGVFPGNVQLAVTAHRSPRAGAGFRALTLGRLPLQAPLVAWAYRVAREAAAGGAPAAGQLPPQDAGTASPVLRPSTGPS